MNSSNWSRRGPVHLFILTLLGILILGWPTAVQAQTGSSNISTPPSSQTPVEVYVDLYGLNIFRIDEREETFEIEAFIYADWFDERLAFDPAAEGTDIKVFQGETAVEMLKTDVWWPDLEIVDSRGPRERLHTTLTIDYDGFVTYTERFHVNIWQPFFFEEFPFDYHEISFTVAPFFYTSEQVIILGPDDFGEGELVERQELFWETNEWRIDRIETSVERGEAFEFSSSTLTIEISRLPNFYITNVVIPLILIVAISWAVFWMDFGNMHLADRLSVSFTSVLTVVAFDFVTASNLPRLPYQTVLDQLITFSYFMLTLSVLENVVSYLWYRRNEGEIQRIDRAARWLFPLLYFAGFVVIMLFL